METPIYTIINKPKVTGTYSPLVSVSIPAFKHEFFEEALESTLSQTYKNLEITICDDSFDNKIKKIVNLKNDARIKYIKNKPHLGPRANLKKCVSISNGRYIKLLNDDDILEKDCIEVMVKYFETYGNKVSLISSKRKKIDVNGKQLPLYRHNLQLSNKDIYISGMQLGNFVLSSIFNFIGEPSTVMFRRNDANSIKHGLFNFKNGKTYCGTDLIGWLNLLTIGDCIYIAKPLSCFRDSPNQLGKSVKTRIRCLISWLYIIINARKLGYLKEHKLFFTAICNYFILPINRLFR